jgi:hypothetical protein
MTVLAVRRFGQAQHDKTTRHPGPKLRHAGLDPVRDPLHSGCEKTRKHRSMDTGLRRHDGLYL